MLETAIAYTRLGRKVIPVPFRSKNPNRKGWQSLHLSEEDLPGFFATGLQNIGVLTGEPSGWLVDIDLDHPRAICLADTHLPSTPAVFGRASKQRSHRIYRVKGPIASKKFKSKAQGMIVEIRSSGLQTVFPPSTHPSGEVIEWDDPDAVPAEVDPQVLFVAVQRLAHDVREQLGEKPKPKERKEQAASREEPAGTSSVQRCLHAMERMKMVHHKDGSDRLFAVACRTVEWDLDETQAITCSRTYAAQNPFPREWTDDEVAQRLRDAERKAVRGCALRKDSSGEREGSHASILLQLCAKAGIDLFHDDDRGYATIIVAGHHETLLIKSGGFKRWLARLFYHAPSRSRVFAGPHRHDRGPRGESVLRWAGDEGSCSPG